MEALKRFYGRGTGLRASVRDGRAYYWRLPEPLREVRLV